MHGRTSLVLLVVSVVFWSSNARGQSVVTGLDAGSVPEVSVFDAATAARTSSFFAFDPSLTAGVRVATGDITGDGTPDIVVAAGPGGTPHIKVFDGTSFALLHSFLAFAPGFAGGVFVAAGDVNGDGTDDIIAGADAGGGPHVKVFDGRSLQESQSFFAFDPGFTGGVRVAAGDLNGDGTADIVVGAGPTGVEPQPHIRVFSSGNQTASFFAFPTSFQGGVYVAAGDVNGDGRDDIIVGAGPGAGPHVKIFDAVTLAERASFFAFDRNVVNGVRVAAGDVTGDGVDDILIGGTTVFDAPTVKVFRGDTLALVQSFQAAAPTFTAGVFVAASVDRCPASTPEEKLTVLMGEVRIALFHAIHLLHNAEALIEAGDDGAACGMIKAFASRVAAQSGKHLTEAQATHFMLSAENIRTALACR